MATRARNFLIASLVAVPCLAFSGPGEGHNGRDGAPPTPQADPDAGTEAPYRLIDIYEGIRVTVDPKTGVRSYTQVGDIPANNGRAPAHAVATSTGPGVDWWVEKSMSMDSSVGYVTPPPAYSAPQDSRVEMYDEGYYGGYGYAYGYGGYGGYGGGRHDRPGRGHGAGGGGRPDRPGHGGGSGGGSSGGTPTFSTRLQPGSRWSPPPGPAGGGVGSPSPYPSSGIGAPLPYRYNSFRGGRRR